VHDARGNRDVVEIGDAPFAGVQRRQEGIPAQAVAIVVDLERADAGCDVHDAGKILGAQRGLERVDAEAQVQVEDVRTIFDQQVAVAGGAADHSGARGHCSTGILACVFEAHRVPGFELTNFPKLVVNDSGGAHEAAERGAVGAENHRHVACEVDGANGVGVVVDVRRVQSGFAAVFARPSGFGADQAHARAVGVVVDFPVSGEESVDVFGCEEVRRSVGTVHNSDLPLVRKMRLGGAGAFACQPIFYQVLRERSRQDSQTVSGPQHAAEAAQDEGTAAAQIDRHVESARDREVTADAGLRDRRHFQPIPGLHGNCLVAGHRRALEAGAEIGSGDRDDRVAREAQSRSGDCDLQSGGVCGVAHQAVREAKGKIVHRA